MVCYNDRNFDVATIPSHRRDIHLKKWASLLLFLLEPTMNLNTDSSHKATASAYAIRPRLQPSRRSATNEVHPSSASLPAYTPLQRMHAYSFLWILTDTCTSYVDDLDSVDDISGSSAPPFTCIVEESTSGAGADVHVAMISISPSSGDVVWDAFDGEKAIHFQ